MTLHAPAPFVPLDTPAGLISVTGQVAPSPSADEAARLVDYGKLLDRWNQRINLTASRGLSAILERQVLDCLMVDTLPWPAPTSTAQPGGLEVVDIGSGAGLPGLLVALRHPNFRVVSLERTGKKASFQREAARLLHLSNVSVIQEDAWQHAKGQGRSHYQVALARGFADLAETLPLAAELLRPGGVLRTFKGRKLAEEIAAIPPATRALFTSEVTERPYEVPGTSVAGVLVQLQRA